MTNKEIFDQYKALRDKYIWVSGELHFSMHDGDLDLDDVLLWDGPFPDDMKESIGEALISGADPSVGYSGECGDIDRAGVYSFDAIARWVPAQIEVLHIEVSYEYDPVHFTPDDDYDWEDGDLPF